MTTNFRSATTAMTLILLTAGALVAGWVYGRTWSTPLIEVRCPDPPSPPPASLEPPVIYQCQPCQELECGELQVKAPCEPIPRGTWEPGGAPTLF